MTKRKRGSLSASRSTEARPLNPFLKFGYPTHEQEQKYSKRTKSSSHLGNDDRMGTKDVVFATFLSFVELTRKKSTPESKSETYTVVKKLLSFLPAIGIIDSGSSLGPEQLDESILSSVDIVTILLPWSIKTLLRSVSSNDETTNESRTPWQTLKACLEFVGQQRPNLDKAAIIKTKTKGSMVNVSDILTLGTLHKIVPLSIKVALSDNERPSQSTAAACYCILVDHYYMAPFDSLCDSLLPMIDRDVRRDASEEDDNDMDGAMFQAMVVSTLRLLHRRLGKANPKKSFQKLITNDIFVVLTKIYMRGGEGWQHDPRQILEDLLLEGLFHLEHHVDGFRSIPMKIPNCFSTENENRNADTSKTAKPFHCYQEGLLPLIANGLSQSGKPPQEIASFVRILPVLLKCFIRQTLILRDQINDKATAKKKASDGRKILQLQFRFFSVLSAHLLIRLDASGKGADVIDRAEIYLSLENNLNLVLEHDVYLPTMDDKKEIHFRFLANLGSSIVERFGGNRSGEQGKSESDERRKALACLNVLVQLNHLTLHDSLPRVLAHCVTSTRISNEDILYTEAPNFTITLISTYKKLRQLDYFVSSFVDAVDLLKKSKKGQSIEDLNLLVDDANVQSALADAIFSSPVSQIKETFARLNDWIVHQSSFGEGSSQKSIDAVVSLFVLLLQNVRIDMNTANEVYPLCDAIMTGAVQRTISMHDATKSRVSSDSQNGLKIFGHVIALLNKCEFWIERTVERYQGDTNRFEIPKRLSEMLYSATESSDLDEAISQELQYLACQYVQRLHSQMQEKQQAMFASDDMVYSNEELIAAARKLAQFALQISTFEEMDNVDVQQRAASLRFLADSISSWAPYVEQAEIVTFLSNFFFIHSLHDSSNIDASICTRLLGDSEFFEAKHVTESLGCALVSCTAKLTQECLHPEFKIKQFSSNYLTCPTSHLSWTQSTPCQLNQITTITGEILKGKILKSQKAKVLLEGASLCVGMLKSMPPSIWIDQKNCINSLDLLLRLDLVYRSICEKESKFQGTAVDILTSLREVSSHILMSLNLSNQVALLGDSSTHLKYVECVSISTLSLMAKVMHNNENYFRLVNSSKRLFHAIVRYAMLQPDGPNSILKGIDSILSKSHPSIDESTTLRNAILIQAIVKNVDPSRNLIASHKVALRKMIGLILRIAVRDFLPISLGEKPASSILRNESTRIVGELLKFDSNNTSDGLVETDDKKILEENVMKAAKKMYPFQVKRRLDDYLICGLALSKPSRSTRTLLANGIVFDESASNNILEAAFSELVFDLDSTELEPLLRSLTLFPKAEGSAPFRLRLIHLLILKLAPTIKLPTVAAYARQFFNLALQCIVKNKKLQSNFDETVHCAVSLITDMASNRDIISLRESDIALVLCHVSSTLNVLDGSRDADTISTTTSVYVSCCSMMTFFLQRFPKQLHSCVSLVSGILVVLLQRALHGDFTKQEGKIRCQKYTRLCELLQPYRDVYKKHVLPVLLEFVKALRSNLDPIKKNDIMPAIFCILDILQQHESLQLNCMLDDMGRAVLRSVHTNYQRAHVYKGQ